MLESFDPEIYDLIKQEEASSRRWVDLRPHRNYLSQAVLDALGSQLADHYVEGCLGGRFSEGSAEGDLIEALGIERLKEIFHAEDALLQPMHYPLAVAALFEGILKRGDTVLTPEPGQGTSLVFGHPSTAWAERFRFVRYGPDPETHAFDPDEMIRLVERSSPALIVVSLVPYPRQQEISFWRRAADRIRALLLVDLSYAAGLVPCGILPSPAEKADIVIGATSGLLRGPSGGFLLFKNRFSDRIQMGLFPRLQSGTAVNLLAAGAVALKEAASKAFMEYGIRCVENANRLCRILKDRGFHVWSEGTDYHYLILMTRSMGLSGKEAESLLRDAQIAATRVKIPFCEGCPNQGDGLILSTQAVTILEKDHSALETLTDKISKALR